MTATTSPEAVTCVGFGWRPPRSADPGSRTTHYSANSTPRGRSRAMTQTGSGLDAPLIVASRP